MFVLIYLYISSYTHTYVCIYSSLTEKTDELKECKEEFESKQTELKNEVDKLKNDNKRCVCTYIRSYIQVHVCIYVYIHVCILYVCKYSKFQIL